MMIFMNTLYATVISAQIGNYGGWAIARPSQGGEDLILCG